MSLRDLEQAVCLPVYPQLDLEPSGASGVFIHCNKRGKVLDMYGGHAVAALGYGHPALTRAVLDQTKAMVFQSNAVALQERVDAARKLIDFAPEFVERVFFCNSGGEANENALRMACMVTGRKKIIAVEHGFHGRTAAAAAVTYGSDKRWYGFPNKPFDVEFIARDDIQAAKNAIDSQCAAVIIEPVQGVAGAYDFDPDFMQCLQSSCNNAGALLIADEVQSGMGRSGHAFAVERYGITPDIITAAKSLGGGFPCAALLCSSELASQFRHGDLGTTFGGGPVIARAISAVIDTIENESLLQNVQAAEQQIRAECCIGPVHKVSGMGLLLGLHLDQPAAQVRDRLLDLNILTGTSADPRVLRILAPLVLQDKHIHQFTAALRQV